MKNTVNIITTTTATRPVGTTGRPAVLGVLTMFNRLIM